jgi:hypothetical protein
MEIDSIGSSCEAFTKEPEFSKESTDLKRRTQKTWLQTSLLNITGTTKPKVHTFSWVIYDRAADDKIGKFLKSSEFCRETVQYSYEGDQYELVIIFNPEKLPLRKNTYDSSINKVLIIDTSKSVPSLLKKHFEELCTQSRIELADATFNLGYYSDWSSLRTLTPVKNPPAPPAIAKKTEETLAPKRTEPKQTPTQVKNPTVNTAIAKKAEEAIATKSAESKQPTTPIESPRVIPKPIEKKTEETLPPKSTESNRESGSLFGWLYEFFN